MNEQFEQWLETATAEELRQHIRTTESVLAERDRVLEAIPECPLHGNQCVPHALEWINARIKEGSECEDDDDCTCPKNSLGIIMVQAHDCPVHGWR